MMGLSKLKAKQGLQKGKQAMGLSKGPDPTKRALRIIAGEHSEMLAQQAQNQGYTPRPIPMTGVYTLIPKSCTT